MARLSKSELIGKVEDAFRAGDWNILYLSTPGEHPARYRIYKGDEAFTVRAYIWNISHGGESRSESEYRIQITGLSKNQFEPEPKGKTLILGFSDDDQIFAGFDYRFHSAPFGGSPSLQIGLPALQGAIVSRVATYRKKSGELAIAFRPDFLVTYVKNLEPLHDTGKVASEVDLLARIAADPGAVADKEIDEGFAATRKWAVVNTRRVLRALDFSDRVLKAYENSCAMCGVQLRLLDGAHILPVADSASTDETANGVALCALHHRAYDRGIVTFDAKFRIHVSETRVTELTAAGLDGGLDDFREGLLESIGLPADPSKRPRQTFVDQANVLRGWVLDD